MTEFLQQLINGLALGSILALIALGYTMVYGILRFINFAHGDVFMLGAFAGFYLAPKIATVLPMPSIWSGIAVMGVSMAICAVIGIVIERLAYRPLRRSPKLTMLITAIGISLFLEYTGQFVFGAAPKSFPRILPVYAITKFGGLSLNSNQIVVFAVTLLLLFALRFVVLKTKIGMAMRALSFNPEAAALMGVNTDIVISFTFGLGSALAGAAGILFAVNYPAIDPLMGIMPGLKAFVAAVLGGIGNLPGAALGGIIIGVTETLVAGYISSTYRDAIAFGILILILIIKPSGLLGKKEIEKV
ncbi:MAG TPA: branched-chain amino acid ABC transporter permease [Candidatus Paceibacterota bacterium]|nr:branched-chain amino acid ABC transporter permease [Candidatus Paceibacterota bacterium]